VSVPRISIVVEAGDWPDRRKLRSIANSALRAAEKALAATYDRSPLSVSPPQEGGGDVSPSELSIVFTSDAEMRKLNKKWRGKDSPTNVLSFPQIAPIRSPASGPSSRAPRAPKPGKSAVPEESARLLGDVILSAETVAREAALASKPLVDHMAHLIIHGYLHLLGFDHETEADAEKMEQLERVALRALGISDPYATAS
jgi:probable rRNA maturation factor